MKKFLIIKDTVANGQRVNAGDVVELSEHEGHALCGYGKASVHIQKPKAEKQDRSIGLKTSKVQAPKTRAKK